MQQYFVNGKADKLVTITDKDTGFAGRHAGSRSFNAGDAKTGL